MVNREQPLDEAPATVVEHDRPIARLAVAIDPEEIAVIRVPWIAMIIEIVTIAARTE